MFRTVIHSTVSAGNIQQLTLLISVVALLSAVLKPPIGQDPSPGQASGPSACRIQLLNHFLFEHGLDNINMFRIVRWVV